MYNLRPRVRAITAVRPQLGMGTRAPPTVASAVVSQVTYSQAMELLEEVSTVPVTEMQISDSDVMIGIEKKVRLKRYQERQLSLLISPHTYRRILQMSTVEYQITNNIH